MNVNHIACGTAITLGCVAGGSVLGAVTATTTVATVAFAALALVAAAFSVASMTAWAALKGETDQSASNYFSTMANHAGFATVGFVQFAAQSLVAALFQGVAEGARERARKMIA